MRITVTHGGPKNHFAGQNWPVGQQLDQAGLVKINTVLSKMLEISGFYKILSILVVNAYLKHCSIHTRKNETRQKIICIHGVPRVMNVKMFALQQ